MGGEGWKRGGGGGGVDTPAADQTETNSNSANYYLFIMEISPSSSFLPLFLTLTSLPRPPRYIGGGTVLTLKSNYLSFTCLSPPPTSDNTFPVKGEIIIFPRIKNQTWGRRQPLSQYVARHMGLWD